MGASRHNIKDLKPSRNSRYKQGYVNPQSCKKLFPSITREAIIYRSSYELKFIQWLESNRDVKYWGSECLQIPYYSGLDGKTHIYNPDYVVEMINGDVMVIEIKPYNQTIRPVNENCWAYREYIKNMYKWKAAKEMCDDKGYKFKILTEKTINQL